MDLLLAAPPGSAPVTHGPTRFIARQPIFDRHEEVYGYELLFRSGLENRFTADDADAAACDVTDYFLNDGPRTLTAGRKAFINCTRQFLVNDYTTLLPKVEAVIEILETVEPDAEALAACRRLKALGYIIALDDFVYAEKFQPFVELADIIKIDFKLSPPSVRQEAVAEFAPLGIRLLAEKLETRAEFMEARECGYDYFQGYFFCKPQIVLSPHIPAFKIHYLQILQAINRPELDRKEIVGLIDRDVSLRYKLLRFVNSPLFGFRKEITSTWHALTLLGDGEMKKWVSIAAVLGIADDKPHELVFTSLIRGRCGELLAANRNGRDDGQNMFLLGIFSLMEPMLDRPISEIVSEIALPGVVRAALVGRSNHYLEILNLIKAYEAGRWSEVSERIVYLRQDEGQLATAFLEAVEWAQLVFQV